MGQQLFDRFNAIADQRLPVKRVNLPDLTDVMDLGRSENFSHFIPKHRRIAGRLTNIFMGKSPINVSQICNAKIFVLFNFVFYRCDRC